MSNTPDLATTLSTELKDYVTGQPFNNLSLVLSYLSYLETLDSPRMPAEAIANWPLESSALIESYGGTNCVGAIEVVRNRLNQRGISSETIMSRNFAFCPDIVQFSHVALLVTDQVNETSYIVDPGLGLVEPVPVNGEQSTRIADRIYRVMLENGDPTLEITKPDQSRFHFRFAHGEGVDTENVVQKPLFRATPSFKIDAFNQEGHKMGSIKLDFLNGRIDFFIYGDQGSISFEEFEEFVITAEFETLKEVLEDSDLAAKIRQAVAGKSDIVNMWFEPLQRQYYLENSRELSPFETSWKELEERGYKGGGVVVILLNEQNEVMFYEVPEGKEKPHIDRYPGQSNLFVETADPKEKNGSVAVADLEDFPSNLERTFAEEIGLAVPTEFIYREVDYRPHVRARCIVARVPATDIEQVERHILHRQQETGKIELGPLHWVSVNELHARWLEPNAQLILDKLITAGILSRDESPQELDEANIE